MTPMQIIFLIIAATTLGSALMVVTSSNMVHSALWLVLALFGVTIFFVTLDAGFLAVAQVVIYIGAISILLIFAIMLTRRVARDQDPQLNPGWYWAALLAVVMFGGLSWMVSNWSGFSTPLPAMPAGSNPLDQLGLALVSPDAYILPFEVASILLLAALVGAIVVAWDKK